MWVRGERGRFGGCGDRCNLIKVSAETMRPSHHERGGMTEDVLRSNQMRVEVGAGEQEWAEGKGVYKAKRDLHPGDSNLS